MSVQYPEGVPVERVAVAVVGGGPAGLTAAAVIASRGVRVVVLERESEPGGVPRHSDHPGFGMRDLRRFLRGPEYASRLVDRAVGRGVDLRVETQVTGWTGDRRLLVTSPAGRVVIDADAVVLATGARERPRAARLIAGDRPGGVLTTGQLQNMVHVYSQPVGHRAVVVGAELVSWSAVLTLRQAGCRTIARTTEYHRPESPFSAVGGSVLRVPTLARARVVQITGAGRVESVTVQHLDTGRRTTIACDTVVMTGSWIPDHELARMAGLDMDPATLGPVVDPALRTSEPGIFAAGNVVHPVDTADNAALDGSHVARAVQQWLNGDPAAAGNGALRCDRPLRWVTPQRLSPELPPRGDLLFWSDAFRRFPRLRARQGGAVIGELRTPWPMAPGRVFRAPAKLVAGADLRGGPVSVEMM
jgi:thioredoxin reductase